ncbi:Transposase [Popillia japonica]|uniref:Transposase n=1 Tax=Popillia japonica TaxID=7064 RepID=A0AAW1MCD6_POPJA
MGGKPHCSQNERNLKRQLWREGKTYRKKSKLIKLSENMITNALKPQKNTKNRDRPRKPTRKSDRYIVRLAKRDPFLTSVNILNEISTNMGSRTIRRNLQNNNLNERSARKVPCLSKKISKNESSFRKDM